MQVHQPAMNHEIPEKARISFPVSRAWAALDTPSKTPESTAVAISASGLLNQLMLNCHVKTVNLRPEEPIV
jgi:hypothetical protein